MKGYSLMRQMSAGAVMCLFLISLVLPGTTGQPILKEKKFGGKGCSDLFDISGMMGKNGWYISNVQITIHPPDGAWHIYYSFDNDTWTEYTTPLIVDSDGLYTLYCFYRIDGNQSEVFSVNFKIAKTPPFVNISFHREGCRILVSVCALDNMSGVVLVEFYLDDALIGNITAAPYVFELSIGLFGEHSVGVIVYDAAGNSAGASHIFPYDLSYFQQSLLQHLMRGLQNLISLYQSLIEMNGVS